MTRTIISVPRVASKEVINDLKNNKTPVNDYVLSEIKEGLERKMYAQMDTLAKTVILLGYAYSNDGTNELDRAVHEFRETVDRMLKWEV